jgi:hypothetical protein
MRGFVFTPFAAEDFLRASMPADPDAPLGLRLYDGAENPGQLLALARGALRLAVSSRRWWMLPGGAGCWWWKRRRGDDHALDDDAAVRPARATCCWCWPGWSASRWAKTAWRSPGSSSNPRSDSLTRELNHRVKNTLANVLSIIALTRRRARDLDSFVESLEGRIRALSATHDLLTQSDWGAADRPGDSRRAGTLCARADRHVDMAGPDMCSLPPTMPCRWAWRFTSWRPMPPSMARSVPGGRSTVRWELASETTARICGEQGGPPIDPTVRRKPALAPT